MKIDFKNRKIQVVSALVAVAVLAAVVYCVAGGRLERMVEAIASQSLRTDVEISRIAIGFSDKSITVRGVRIRNPEGFTVQNALVIGKIRIAADALTSDTITFNEVAVEGLEVTYELAGAKTNLGALQGSLKRPAQSAPQEKAAPAKDVVIKKLEITKGQLIPAISVAGKGASAPLSLPDIRMTNVGGKDRALSASRAINLVLSEIISTAARTASKEGLLKGTAETVKSATQGAATKAGDKVKMILNP